MVKVWDPALRLFHWGLVASFAIAYLSAEEASGLHQQAGYVVAGLLAFRLVWGLIGPRYARFGQFLRGPGAVLAYLGQMLRGTEPRHLGHNPAGAAMIVAILLTLSGTALTGWMMAEPGRGAWLQSLPMPAGPAFADDDEGEGEGEGLALGGEGLEDLHGLLANLMLGLIALHVGGVVLASRRHRENLAGAMITGMKPAPGPGDIA